MALENTPTQQLYDRIPPQNIEIEKNILGSLMLEKDAITTVIDILHPSTFYDPANRDVFIAILDLFTNNCPIDINTVINQLKKNDKLDSVGGAYYVYSLTERVISTINLEYHTYLITEYAIKRELISIGGELQRQAYDNTIDVFNLLNTAENKLFNLSANNLKKNYCDIKTLLNQEIKNIKNRKEAKTGITGIPSGFKDLDFITSGWQKSD